MRLATRMHFTKKTVEGIKLPSDGRITVYDDEVQELGLRVAPTGKRSFFWLRRVNGKVVFRLIGYYPATSVEQARGKAREFTGTLEKFRRNDFTGENPFAPPVVATTSAEAVAEEWILREVKTQRQAYETERILRKEILPACKNKMITDITRADALRILDGIRDRGALVVANRTLGIFQRWMKWCIERGYLEASPVAVIRKTEESSRDRVLTDSEVGAIWKAAGAFPYPEGPYLQLLILTAQRRREVAGMCWANVDLKSGIWTLPAEQAKSDRVSDVPLVPEAVKILKSLPRHKGISTQPNGAENTEYVFSNTHGKKPINGFSKFKARLDATTNPALADWHLHDIRRTIATHAAKSGVIPVVLSALLNHSLGPQQGLAAVYNRHKYTDERRAALASWAKFVLAQAKKARVANRPVIAKAS